MLQRFRVAFSVFRLIWRVYPAPFVVEVLSEDKISEKFGKNLENQEFFPVPDDFEGISLNDVVADRNATRH